MGRKIQKMIFFLLFSKSIIGLIPCIVNMTSGSKSEQDSLPDDDGDDSEGEQLLRSLVKLEMLKVELLAFQSELK